MKVPILQNEIQRLEIGARILRGLAAGWCAFTVATFALLAASADYAQSRPVFICGAILVLFFLIVLCQPLKLDVRNHLPRVIMVLQWQVATGVIIAFTLSFVVSDELRIGFQLLGSYLVIPAVFLMVLRLIELGLRSKYSAIDDLAKENAQKMLISNIAAATARELTGALVRGKRRGIFPWPKG